ncbi:type II toxin-antitoxin system PemK/MazF family toxin [Actimicrobium sp. CCC2.4]|uniref:type II toxin-antitoxin system PemK/MazF family toxin n=1 Tax=Actimicrobium sp. CCC2.4 TaxID=3048606 RepID=UPI002AC8BC27|nr:type II toxin-antitoxin system PemK/MazF family toxin [Actimicrobium sp. CCC2.4]MEB0137069.1 type II toxin-antitoxin system PemK/MazF family toxin [Actimicrobium sp. CCC2.4]WPX33654.1 type II toxin-antitoxin system PemK/MazF family toxin [Actimicrobium sp. CCC2.4]
MASKIWVPDRQDIIWIDFNPQVGREMKDMHPLLVLSPKEFNARTRIVIGLPMTTSQSNDSNPFAVKFVGEKGKAGYILAHQPKSFDWQLRGAKPHPWKKIPTDVMTSAGKLLNQIITIGD